jgi:hypothetical protein
MSPPFAVLLTPEYQVKVLDRETKFHRDLEPEEAAQLAQALWRGATQAKRSRKAA